MAVLPLHRAPSSSRARYGREKIILLFIFILFAVVCFGAFFFVPDFRDKLAANPSVPNPVQAFVNNHVQQVVAPHHDDPGGRRVLAPKDEASSATPSLRTGEDVKRGTAAKKVENVETRAPEPVTTPKPAPKPTEKPAETAKPAPPDPENTKRREFIVQMARHAWKGYEQYAWGQNELKPISRVGHSASIFGASAMGATIVDSLDTLYIMGLKDEFKKARDWVANNLNFNNGAQVSVFEITIRFVGGLLSAYALTKDEVFKTKAIDLGRKLLPAFNTPSGLSYAQVSLGNGAGRNWNWASGGCSILAEVGTMHLEFAYLTAISGDPVFFQKVQKIRDVLQEVDHPNGLYYNFISPHTKAWCQRHVSMGALGDSFYEYLLKSYIQSNRTDTRARKMYDDAMRALEPLIITTTGDHLMFIAEKKEPSVLNKMDHLACFCAGMMALGVADAPEDLKGKYKAWSKGITKTCHESYDRTATKIGPESFYFDAGGDAKGTNSRQRYYILRPEVIESYFYMWRLTKDPIYRQFGWEAAQAIERHCRVENGYSGIRDVESVPAQRDDVQQSFFIAETLKYLYLLFSDDDVISLDKWVFNTEAHPLPVLKGMPSAS